MYTKGLDKLPYKVKKILKLSSRVAEHLRCKIYLVGGIVRDLLLERENLDLDIVVEGRALEFAKFLAQSLGTRFCKHHLFGTATVYWDDLKVDIATARLESYPRWGALPRVAPSSLKDDLFRRDFTINAMALSLNKTDYGKLIDLYGGYRDLKQGLIRVLHDKSFLEDPTRIFRAIRFEQRFSFRIENHSAKLLREAVERNALSFVNEHRIRDELILILKEKTPYSYIKRINDLIGFHFLDKKLKLAKSDFYLLKRIESTISFFREQYPLRKPEMWLVYLIGIVHKLSQKDILKFCSRFGLRKTERIIILSVLENKQRLSVLRRDNLSRVGIYKLLKPLIYEAIIFFYAYFKDRKTKERLKYFLDELSCIKLKVRGHDLVREGIKPQTSYSRILKTLLYRKIEKKLTTKQQELKELRRIIKRQSNKVPINQLTNYQF
jgi:tRNA nucleotidyltransferase (CCA-adding enzyme)